MKLFARKEIDITFLSKGFLIGATIIHLIFILSLFYGFLNPLYYDSSYGIGQGADFFAYYQAGYNLINGLSPYHNIPGYNIVPYAYGYRYLPFFAHTFGMLFNIFPPRISYWVWIIFLLALIWYTSWITHKICNSLNMPKWVEYIAIGMWLCYSPIYIELYSGQATLFIGILTFFSFYAESKKKEKVGIFYWTFGCLIKYMPYLLAPAILCSGRTRKVLYNILFSILAILFFGFVYFSYFVEFNLKAGILLYATKQSFDFKSVIYLTGRILIGNKDWFSDDINTLLNIILPFTFIGLSTVATIYSKDYLVSLSLFACSYFLFFSGIWEHHFTFILPFLVILWIRDKKRLKWFLIFIFLAIPTPFYFFELFKLWNVPILLLFKCSKVIPILILFILLLKEAYKKPRQEAFIDSLKEVSKSIYLGFKDPKIDKFPNVFTI